MRLLATSTAMMMLITACSFVGAADDATRLSRKSPVRSAAIKVAPDGKANQIVVYSATWCRPCQRLKPVIVSLKQEGYKVVYRDIDRDIDRLRFDYTAVPTIFFLNGRSVIKKETGYRSKEQIKRTLVLDADAKPSPDVLGWK